MPDDKDDPFQASMIALHGSTCSADLDYLQVSTPKARRHFQESHHSFSPPFTVCSTCRSSQLAARLDLVHDHPRFAPSSGLAGATQTHVQDLSTILDPHDHFLLSQRPQKVEEFSLAMEEAVESLHLQQEVAVASPPPPSPWNASTTGRSAFIPNCFELSPPRTERFARKGSATSTRRPPAAVLKGRSQSSRATAASVCIHFSH